MNSINDYYIQAQLAQAAYANLTSLIPDILSLKEDAGMSPEQARIFAENWRVVKQFNGISGASATVFEKVTSNGQSGQKYLAIRGTELTDRRDITADYVLAAGFPVFINAQFIQIQSQISDWLIDGTLSAGFTVAGHSLGGYLASGIGSWFSESTDTYLFSAPGVGGLVGNVFDSFKTALGLGDIPLVSDIHNIRGVAGTSLIGGLGAQLSPVIPIEIEAASGLGLDNHSIGRLTDALAVYALFNRITPSLALEQIGNIILTSSNRNDKSLESAKQVLAQLIIPGSPTIENHDDLHQRLQDIEAELYINPNAAAPQLKPQYQNLHITDVASLAGSAQLDSADGLAYRYALIQLNPFAITGSQPLYAQHNAQGELNKENFSEQYLADRARFLNLKTQLALTDSSTEPLPLTPEYFEDKALEIVIDNRKDSSTLPSGESARYLFGSEEGDELLGGKKQDHLYGGSGNDLLNGKGGNNYLEGGLDDDTLLGGKNGNDTLNGGKGNDTYSLSGSGTVEIEDKEGSEIYMLADFTGQVTINDEDKSGDLLYINKQSSNQVFRAEDGSESTWKSFDGKTTITLNSSLTISNENGSTIVINNYQEGDFGFILKDAFAESEKIIQGDLAYKDFDSSKDGIQTQTDELGNIITIEGSVKEQEDRLLGSGEADQIQSGTLNDTVNGKAGDDIIEGGKGIDILEGGAGDDRLYANEKSDFNTIFDTDTKEPGDTKDWLAGGNGNDQLIGSTGGDGLSGGSGHDLLVGGKGNDYIFGDRDWVASNTDWKATEQKGNVKFEQGIIKKPENSAEEGSDTIYAGSGDDWVWAGGGNDDVSGGSGKDRLMGEKGDDIIQGGSDSDIIIGGAGDDYLYADKDNDFASAFDSTDTEEGSTRDWLTGGEGDDQLIGSTGSDALFGGAGNDLLVGGAGDDYILSDIDLVPKSFDWSVEVNQNIYTFKPVNQSQEQGSAGADSIYAGSGDDHVLAGGDNDNVFGGSGSDWLQGEEGDDNLQGDDGDDTLFGQSGNDNLFGGSDNDWLNGGEGDDNLHGNDGDDILFGTSGNDILSGGNDNDELKGGEGNDNLQGDDGIDLLFGENGNDSLYGGNDNDELQGGEGDDMLDGGSGDDLLIGHNGNDTLSGGDGNDELQGYEEDDIISGGTGDDILFGGLGWDQLSGGDGEDFLNGEEDNDILNGGAGDDELQGGEGDDTLDGASDGDRLFGQDGEDFLIGGLGNDELIGGGGNDSYFFSIGDGIDIIDDWEGDNQIHFDSSLSLNAISAELVNGSNGSSYLALQYSNTDVVYIKDGAQGTIQSYAIGGTSYHYSELIESTQTQAMNFQLSKNSGALYASRFNDTLKGSSAADEIHGQRGNDILAGGAGDDLLDGGEGQDTYILGIGSGTDQIIESAGEINTIRLHEGLSISDLATEKRGQDLFLHLQGRQDGVILERYYTNHPEWRIETADGSISALSGLTLAKTSLVADSIADLMDNYIEQVKAFYFGALKVNGFRLASDGLYHKDIIYKGNNYKTTQKYHLGIEIDTQVIDGNIVADNRSIESKNFRKTSALINTFTQEETVSKLNTQNIKFSIGGNSSNGRYVDIDEVINGGVQYSETETLVPVYGSDTDEDPLTGKTVPEIIGYWMFPNENQVSYSNNTVIVTYNEFENNQHLLLRDIASSGDKNNLQLWDHYFNRVDSGIGDDTLNAEPDYHTYYGAEYDLELSVPDRNKIDLTYSPGSLLYGNTGNDEIRGSHHNDILIGGEGNDLLYGGKGNDVYYQFHGDGHDIIFDEGSLRDSEDIIVLPGGIRASDITVNWNETLMTSRPLEGNWPGRVESLHIVLTISWGTPDRVDIVLPHSKLSIGYGIDQLVFDDGSRMSLTDLVALNDFGPIPSVDPHLSNNILSSEGVLFGGNGDDILMQTTSSSEAGDTSSDESPSAIFNVPRLIGGNGHDQLIGSEGNDQLYGGSIIFYDAVDYADETALVALGGLWDVGNTYQGGLGNDTLWTTAGSDTIEFNLNDGTDKVVDLLHHHLYHIYAYESRKYGGLGSYKLNEQLNEWQDPAALEHGHLEQLLSSHDTLRFGTGINSGDIVISRGSANRSDSLLFSHKNGIDKVIFSNWYSSEVNQLNRVEFADGTVWEGDFLRNMINDRANSTTLVSPIADQIAYEDDRYALSFDLSKFFTSPESLTFNITVDNSSVLPSWIPFTQGRSNWFSVINPTNDEVGNHTIAVTATNASGLTVRDNFVLTVLNTNDAPIVNHTLEDQTAVQGKHFSYKIPDDSFIDVDNGDVLKYNVTLTDGKPLPEWLAFDPSKLTLSGTPGLNDDDISGVRVTVTDQENVSVSNSFNLIIESVPIDVTMGTEQEDFLFGSAIDDSIMGLGGNDKLYGRDGNDTLQGGPGNDILNGGSGIDTMIGGVGDDKYYVDNLGDNVSELADEGIDRVYSSIDHTLGQHLEQLIFTGEADSNGLGNSEDNRLYGNSGANELSGMEGNDLIYGRDGNDTLQGGAGNDILNGGDGADVMAGGLGDDKYYVDNLGDSISESVDESNDSVYSSIDYDLSQNLEQLVLTGEADLNGIGNSEDNRLYGNSGANELSGMEGNDWIYGRDGNDTLQGGDGNDILNGGSGTDVMTGGIGDDKYYIDHLGDSVSELTDEGNDRVYSSIDYTLGQHQEQLIFTGEADLNGLGNSEDNRLYGNSGANKLSGAEGNDRLYGRDGDDWLQGDIGNDILNGGSGIDIMVGGAGDDKYYVDNFDDSISELSDEGNDRVYSSIDYTLAQHLEQLVFTGESNLKGIGNSEDNRLYGNSGANELLDMEGNDRLYGRDGNDTLQGGIGKDYLNGGDGNDQLVGGAGNDSLNGGQGSDTYHFNLGDARDVITDSGSIDNVDQDILKFGEGISTDNLWFSRKTNDLVIDYIGNDDQVRIKNWFSSTNNQIEQISVKNAVLHSNQVANLVNAMSAFNAPSGSGAIVPQDIQDQLAPVLATSWTPAA